MEGLEDGYWDLVSKVHHCLVHGIPDTDLLAVMLDTSPEPSPPVVPRPQPDSVGGGVWRSHTSSA